MINVKQAWEMCCPKCGEDVSIDVSAQVWVRLTPEGTDRDEPTDTSEEWDNNSPCKCAACGHAGTVGDFATDT